MTDAPPTLDERFAARLAGTRRALDAVDADRGVVVAIASTIRDRLGAGGTLYTAGNGGSAAEALHLAEELIGRYRGDRPPLRAVCLNADPTALTCIANDFGFEQVFARPCAALLTPADVLVVFSTSGRSANIVAALKTAAAQGATTIALLGGTGGKGKDLADYALTVPLDDSAHVQEAHQVVMHLICEALE